MAARHDWERHGKSEAPLPVYALLGSSSLLVSEAVSQLRNRVVQTARDFNSDELQAGSVDAALGAARTLPMMAPKRWVHVAQAQRLTAKEHAPLADYLKKPNPTTVLCLSGEKIDQRTKLGQALSKSGALFAFEPPRPSELPAWIGRRATAQGQRIEPEAASLLADLIGGELGNLLMSLDKVALYAGADATITSEHVAAAVASTRIASVFELTDAVGKREWGQASLLLRNILDGGESGLVVLAMVVRQLRQLVLLKTVGERQSQGALAAALGVRPFVVETLRSQAQLFSVTQLHASLAAAADVDAQLKSSRIDHGLILDGLLVQIASAPPT